jgi:N-glycosylase/DNA lyase
VTPEVTSSYETVASVVKSKAIPEDKFEDLMVSPPELRPSATLTTGQCFHWRALPQISNSGGENHSEPITSAWGTHNATDWVGTLRTPLGASVIVAIRETPTSSLYQTLYAPEDLDVRSFLLDYFQLDQSLAVLYENWSKQDERLGRIAQCIPGVRIINQDPWECLVSFICSSNNNIPRITKMLGAIRREYGRLLLQAGEYGLEESIYSFPSLKDLQKGATDQDLRSKCGMGYRAKYILETMKTLESLGGESYLHELKEKSSTGTLSPVEVQEELIQFCGVGRKVADCVALFSLKQSGAIPVDTHVWNIACRDYDKEGALKNVKSLTPTVYLQVGDLFRKRFSMKPGWAHSLLFVAELPSFRVVLPADMIEEMEKVSKLKFALFV